MRRKPLGEAERRLLHSIDVNFVAAVQSAAPSSAAPPAVRYRHSAPPPAAPAVPRVTAAAGEAADTRVDTGVPLSPLPPPLPLASFYGSLPPPALSRRRQPFRDDFRTQAEAFEWGDARCAELEAEARDAAQLHSHFRAPRLVYFSREEHESGSRRFGAAEAGELWRRYSDAPADARHTYELLREDTPCHLYFDLEFSSAANPGLDGERCVDALLELLAEGMRCRLGVELADCTLVELESTPSPSKFSRHLVVRLPGARAFRSSTAVGAFLHAWLAEDVVPTRESDARVAALYVRRREEEEGEVLFIDLGVYTRNRAFRLYLSSKQGKSARLLPTRRCWERLHAAGLAPQPPPTTLDVPQEWLFFESLICCAEPAALLRAPPPAGALPGRGHHAPPPRALETGSGAHCPFPLTAAFACAVADERAGPAAAGSARIRSWAVLSPTLLVLNVSRNRHCARIGRSHKSNGVFYLVDYKEACAWQKCHDPECRGYKSVPEGLPPDACAERRILARFLPEAESWAADDALLAGLSAEEMAALCGE